MASNIAHQPSDSAALHITGPSRHLRNRYVTVGYQPVQLGTNRCSTTLPDQVVGGLLPDWPVTGDGSVEPALGVAQQLPEVGPKPVVTPS